jgi:hypothetical protein
MSEIKPVGIKTAAQAKEIEILRKRIEMFKQTTSATSGGDK